MDRLTNFTEKMLHDQVVPFQIDKYICCDIIAATYISFYQVNEICSIYRIIFRLEFF
jgi:hypothetical protein